MEDLDIISILTRPGTYVLGLAIFIITFFTRRVIESIFPRLKKQSDANSPTLTYMSPMARWWNEVILYALPVLYGMAGGFIKSDFFYDGIDTIGAKISFGVVVGWFSGFLYKLIRKVIAQKFGIEFTPGPSDSVAPPGA